MKNKIKTVIFDVGGVLAIPLVPLKKFRGQNHNLGVHEYVAKKLKISIDQYFDSIDTAHAKSIEGKLSYEELVHLFSLYFKVPMKKIEKFYRKAFKKNFRQNKKLFKPANELKKAGYKIAVLSDQWPLSYKNLMPKKLYSNFDPVVVSCFSGMRKPNPKIYKLTLKKLKLKPSECLFIDNQEWNITPAKKLHIKTILYKNNKQLFKEKIWKELFK
ncbi:MAG: HAD-IA family hydrolase [Candidatus Pacearchaeota archaeon]|jgi:putative hydrolase of the HAD superfamily